MTKLTIAVGLPASGKSTESEKKIKTEGNTVRINKDLLRTMLHFDTFTHTKEQYTREASQVLAEHFLQKDVNVIIDDTNLNPNTKQLWVDLAKKHKVKIEYLDMTHVPVGECIHRDQLREKKVGAHVIQKMALQYLGFLKGQKVVVCDLDGTLCDIEHRRHFVRQEPKDWKNFFAGTLNDTPRYEVIEQMKPFLEEGKNTMLVYVSARPESCRTDTETWLNNHGLGGNILIMREDHDKRPDTEVKTDIYNKYLKDMVIVKVFDDRPSVVRMWQSKGLDVVDVGDGVEF